NKQTGSREPANSGSFSDYRNDSSGSGGSSNYAKNLVAGLKTPAKKPAANVPAYVPPADFKPSDTSSLAEGMKVEHPKFGFGKVTAMDVTGANRKATVDFDTVGEKALLLSFAKLKIHEE